VRYDQRGLGLSGHVPSDQKLGVEAWTDDALAVLDAAGCERAVVMSPGSSAVTGIRLAALYPERVESLIIVNGTARAMWAEDYPFGVTEDYVHDFIDVSVRDDALEQGFDSLGIIAPSVARDASFRSWWDRSGNRAATPSMARATSAAFAATDVRDLLGVIAVPTLIMHRVDNKFAVLGHGRYLAEHIPHAKYVELPGVDNLHWVGDVAPLLDEIEEFVTGIRGSGDTERVLTTVLFTDIVGSTDLAARLGDGRWHTLLDGHDQIVRRELDRFGGCEVNTAGDGFVATFASPSRAIECAEAIVDAVHASGIDVRVGIHAGEVEMRGKDVAGMAVHIGARVAALAGAGEVLVSATVRDIVTGSGRTFTDRGVHDLKGVPGSWALCAAQRRG